MQKILPKKDLNNFIQQLTNSYQVIAPIKKDNTKFQIINNPEEIDLTKITQVSPKKFFIPDNEVISEFKDNKILQPKDNPIKRIIFGLRKCDLNSFLVFDKAIKDTAYIKKRKNTILIGIHCTNPDEFCFCNSMELKDHYDLFFYPKDNQYHISIGSKKGAQLVNNLQNAKEEYTPKIKNTKILKNKDIEKDYKNKIWKTNSEKCLSCSACTVYCPTCNCFDIRDNLSINIKDSKRVKTETSCQLKSFTQIAGGKTFRDSRLSRFKHFVYHKIVYFKKQHNIYMCVGCGRCLRVCPTKIDWVKTINKLKENEVMK